MTIAITCRPKDSIERSVCRGRVARLCPTQLTERDNDETNAAGLPSPYEVARDNRVFQTQTYFGHEALQQAHQPIREDGLGLTNSDVIKGAAYIDCRAFFLRRSIAAFV